MSKALAVAKSEFLNGVLSKAFIVGVVLMPVLMPVMAPSMSPVLMPVIGVGDYAGTDAQPPPSLAPA